MESSQEAEDLFKPERRHCLQASDTRVCPTLNSTLSVIPTLQPCSINMAKSINSVKICVRNIARFQKL